MLRVDAKSHIGQFAANDPSALPRLILNQARRLRFKVPVVPLPAVSSVECVAVLEGVGFTVASTTEGCTLLEGRGRLVVVPDDPILDYEVLCMVLSAAGMTALEFLELLDAPLPIVHARSA